MLSDRVERALESALVDKHETEPHDNLVAELREMEKREIFLSCLEQAGVDNWSGIDYAFKILDGLK